MRFDRQTIWTIAGFALFTMIAACMASINIMLKDWSDVGFWGGVGFLACGACLSFVNAQFVYEEHYANLGKSKNAPPINPYEAPRSFFGDRPTHPTRTHQ